MLLSPVVIESLEVACSRSDGVVLQVAWLVSSVFNEMIFSFGDVHCDPHAANMILRKAPGGGMQLVLLDHGLYR